MYDNKVVAKQNRRGEAFRARFNNLDMIQIKYKKITMKIFLVVIFLIMLLPNLTYANTYINNSIEIEVSPKRRSYDYGENVIIDINIKNKNRYGKLHYRKCNRECRKEK